MVFNDSVCVANLFILIVFTMEQMDNIAGMTWLVMNH